MTDVDRSIGGVAKTIAEVLEKKKYVIDYHQREFKWESKQIAELVADLTSKFLELHEPGHARKDVAKYAGYFLGSIIISQKGSEPFVVDGQQRLTSLTLFLTYLRRLQQGREDVVDIDQLIFSEKFGEKSFNLDVSDRNDCMEALFEHIWADHPERHTNEYTHEADFARHRNRIGDLLLLPKQFNASYNDAPYEKKLPHYYGQDLLAASLNQLSYEKNPGFIAFTKSSGLAFKPHAEFMAPAVSERGNLYRDIARKVWNPDDRLTVTEGAF